MSEKPSANTVFVSLLLAASASSAKMHGEIPRGTAFPDPRFVTSDPRLKDSLVSFQGKRCGLPVSLDETLARETREAALCVLTAPASYFDRANTDQFLTDESGTLLRPRVRLPQNRTVKFKRGGNAYTVDAYNENNGTAPGDHIGEQDFIYVNVRPKGAPKSVKGHHIQDTGLTGTVSLGGDKNVGGHEYAPCYDTPMWEDFFKLDYCKARLIDRLMKLKGEEDGMELHKAEMLADQNSECNSEDEAGWPEEREKSTAHYAAKRAQYEAMYRTAISDIRAHCQEKLQRAQLRRPRQRR